jgi:uncharacterized coiled-coil protein SlyX
MSRGSSGAMAMLCVDRGVCALLGFPVDAATVGQALLFLGLLSLLSLLISRGTSRSRLVIVVALAGCLGGWALWALWPPTAHDALHRGKLKSSGFAEEYAELQAEVASKDSTIAELEGKLGSQQGEATAGKYAELQAEVASKDSTIAELEGKLGSQQDEAAADKYAELQAEVASKDSTIDDAAYENRKLRAQVIVLREDLTATRT